MGTRHATALSIVLVAVALGALGDALFYQARFGINLALWTALLVGAGYVVVRRSNLEINKRVAWPTIAALLFGAGFALHDSPGMGLVNVLGLGTSLAVLASTLRRAPHGFMSNLEAGLGPVAHWIMSVVDVFLLFIEDIEWKVLGSRLAIRKAAPIARGVILAVPLLLLFGGLMASADVVFRKVVTRPWEMDFAQLFSHGALFIAFTGLAIGLLRRALLGEEIRYESSVAHPRGTGGAIESTVVLGALVGLFSTFVAIQFRYLFGQRQWVVETTGLSYADYARSGFFELVTLAALTIPVLLVATQLARRGSPQIVRAFTILASTMVGLLSIVMASAFQRMALYISTSGLSELRFYTTAFMIWLGVVTGIYCLTSLVGRPQRFGSLSLGAGLCVGLVLNLCSPGRWIAEHNLAVAKTGRPLDTVYLQELGADAVPVLVRSLSVLPEKQRSGAVHYLSQWPDRDTDWRGLNLSRTRAQRLIEARREELAMVRH